MGLSSNGPDVALSASTTGLSGEYYLSWITPGIYSIEFSHPNYGIDSINGIKIIASDTIVIDFQFGGICDYVPGDVNGNGNANGIDVIYLVAYFKGGSLPPDQCECPPHGELFPAADVNGSCSTNGLDVTYLVSYLKGGPSIIFCADCPPQD